MAPAAPRRRRKDAFALVVANRLGRHATLCRELTDRADHPAVMTFVRACSHSNSSPLSGLDLEVATSCNLLSRPETGPDVTHNPFRHGDTTDAERDELLRNARLPRWSVRYGLLLNR